MSNELALVHILDVPYCADRQYTYFVPPEMREQICVGSFVTVPFGFGNRRCPAVVFGLEDGPSMDDLEGVEEFLSLPKRAPSQDSEGEEETEEKKEVDENGNIKIKPITALANSSLRLSTEMTELCLFMKDMTLCTVGDAVRTVFPSALKSGFKEYYITTDKALPKNPKGLDVQTLFVYEYISSRGKAAGTAIKSRFGAAAEKSIEKLCAKGLIMRELELKETQAGVESRCYSVAVTETEARKKLFGKDGFPRSPKQWSVVATLLDNSELGESDLLRAAKATKAQLDALVKKGIISVRSDISYRLPAATATTGLEGKRELVLNDEQAAAHKILSEQIKAKKPAASLLFGVTGSGKTSVMLAAIDTVIAEGRSVIVLLPEISLTPQTLNIFCSRYGNRVAIIHSGLSQGERIDTLDQITKGGVDVVIGTRSAIFAPLDNLGMIVIDEEQEHTYKSDISPKYHARDIARFRCAKNNAVMLLASATPSIESYKKAVDGVYTLIKLKERYGGAELPQVDIVDMRIDSRVGSVLPISGALAGALMENKRRNEQSILFLNRRGYNNFTTCRKCGKPVTCPRCSVSMTYHTNKDSYDEGNLVCHWCGLRIEMPKVCPECKSTAFAYVGYGTQRVEQDVEILLPGAKVLRMDTDSTVSKDSYNRLLGRFRRHEGDVLLGTQMVTKGHDFPDVTLVGVLLAESSLFLDDYRAAERTFALLTQVVGRAGRGKKRGRAMIQTTNPDNDIIKLACAQDYETFYEREIKLRKQLAFPPFCDIVMFNLTSSGEDDLILASREFNDALRERAAEHKSMPLVIFGPFEAPVYKVDGKYRMRFVIKCRLNSESRGFFSSLLSEFGKRGRIRATVSVDINPSSL